MAYVISDECISCGACESTCPAGAIAEGDGKFEIDADTCLDCGYIGEFNDCCPICGSKNIQQLRRITGYLTGNYKTAFNLGKQNEVHLRIKHIGRLEQ